MEVATASRIFAVLAITADAIFLYLIAIAVVCRVRLRPLPSRLGELLTRYGLWLAWMVATVATTGSLYYSEVANFTPCALCWYQRIAMYPLVLILGIALYRKDPAVRGYAAPLAIVGGALALYHYTIQQLAAVESPFCDPTNPCTVAWVREFGFITIPFMALSGFLLIVTLLMLIPSGRTQR